MTINLKNISVIICSAGRPEILSKFLPYVCNQSLAPLEVIVITPSESDLPDFGPAPEAWATSLKLLNSPKGSCIQRNMGLKNLHPNSDIVFFADDDYLPSFYALEGMAHFFEAHPDINGASGNLLVDGIKLQNFSPQDALDIIAEWDQGNSLQDPVISSKPTVGLYGCNMAFRTTATRNVLFDENLPLYAWLEDVDFGSRIPGTKVYTSGFVGVHCGVKSGRERSGKKLGYSQIANPYYLMFKKNLPFSTGMRNILRNILANHAKAFKPEPWIDRRGRLAGNWLAIKDILLRRSHPGKILSMKS